MNQTQFADFVNRLRHAYQLRSLNEDIIQYLFEECGWIESGCRRQVFEIFRRNNDKFPTKLDLAILSAYNEWSRNKGEPQKQATLKCPNNMPDEEGPCYHGDLILYHEGEEYGHGRNPYAFVCLDCKRSSGGANCPSGTLKELMNKGWSIAQLRPDDPPAPWVTERIALAALGRMPKKEYPPPSLDFKEVVENWPAAAHKVKGDTKERRDPYWE